MTKLVVADGSDISVVDPRGGEQTARIPPHPSGRLANRQPVWAPDGKTLAWSAYDRRRSDAPTIVSIMDVSTGARADHELVFPAFYLHWRPDGRSLAALSEGPLGIELTVVDVADGTQRIVSRGTPHFLDWSSAGELCVHVGQGTDHRVEIVAGNGALDVMPIEQRPGQFTAPAWRGTDEFVVSLQFDGNRSIALVGRDGRVRRELAVARGMSRFAMSSDLRHLALVDSTEIPLGHPTLAGRPNPEPRPGVPLATPDRLVVQDLVDDTVHTVADQPPMSMAWSHDGTKLLYSVRIERGEPPLLQWYVWSVEGVQALSMFRPSSMITREYLPFAEQYARSRSVWSPDGTAFCFAGSDLEGHEGVWVHPLDRRAERLCSGHVAFWAPA